MSVPQNNKAFENYLTPAEFINSDHPQIIEFVKKHTTEGADHLENAISLYNATRDQFIYTPYWDFNDPETFRASNCLVTGKGMCQSKAALLAAAARAIGIPARIGFADVINHMSSQKFLDLLDTNIFYWHAYSDLYLDGKWVKATPAFDAGLCQAFNVPPLEFDGLKDSLFQTSNSDDKKFMEYIGERGIYADLPHEEIIAHFKIHYPHAMKTTHAHIERTLQDDIKLEN